MVGTVTRVWICCFTAMTHEFGIFLEMFLVELNFRLFSALSGFFYRFEDINWNYVFSDVLCRLRELRHCWKHKGFIRFQIF